MTSVEIELPANSKFGYLFALIFSLATGYFYLNTSWTWVFVFGGLALLLLAVTIVKPEALRPLNKLWMKFALLLSVVVSPIVFGIIFFGLVTPYAVVMRFFGRDELRTKRSYRETYWILRSQTQPQTNFSLQF